MNSPVIKHSGFVSVVVIGAGHAGLAISACLTERSIEHVVLERGEVANSWRTQRWDSLKLLTPSWQCQLPGFKYQGANPNGYMGMRELTQHLDAYAQTIKAPVHTHTNVLSLSRTHSGYKVETNRGRWHCKSVVLASGICNRAAIPAMANQLPDSVQSIDPLQYKNPEQLPSGNVLVVGGSATGLQLAEEIHASGRKVTLSVGEHVRMPRMYRGKDIQWWMDQAGYLDQSIESEAEPNRARRLPSPQLIGSTAQRTLDLNMLQAKGISITGRLAGVRDNTALFSGALRNCCALADLKLNRLLEQLDKWAKEAGIDASIEASERFAPTKVPGKPILNLDFEKRGINTVLWATGFRPDYSWLQLPVLDRKGKLIHEQGIVGNETSNTPGVYAMGLSYMRKRKSGTIFGAADDAQHLANNIHEFLIASEQPLEVAC